MYPSGVFSKICNEHSRHYSTILTGNYTVLENFKTFLCTKLRAVGCVYCTAPNKGIRENFAFTI